MRLSFQMAHHQVQNRADVDVQILPEVLIACDKYGCLDTFRFLLHGVLRMWLGKHNIVKPAETMTVPPIADIILEAICMAYLFDDSKTFNDAMRQMFWHTTEEDIESRCHTALMALMPADFHTGLMDSREDAVFGHQTWVCDMLEEWIERNAGTLEDCARTERRLGVAISTMKKHKLREADDESVETAGLQSKEKRQGGLKGWSRRK